MKKLLAFPIFIFSLAEALAAEECFSTASTMSVFPVITIDGHKIGDGKPGEVAKMLSNAYDTVERKLSKN